jgi:hypothetical protein
MAEVLRTATPYCCATLKIDDPVGRAAMMIADCAQNGSSVNT